MATGKRRMRGTILGSMSISQNEILGQIFVNHNQVVPSRFDRIPGTLLQHHYTQPVQTPGRLQQARRLQRHRSRKVSDYDHFFMLVLSRSIGFCSEILAKSGAAPAPQVIRLGPAFDLTGCNMQKWRALHWEQGGKETRWERMDYWLLGCASSLSSSVFLPLDIFIYYLRLLLLSTPSTSSPSIWHASPATCPQ